MDIIDFNKPIETIYGNEAKFAGLFHDDGGSYNFTAYVNGSRKIFNQYGRHKYGQYQLRNKKMAINWTKAFVVAGKPAAVANMSSTAYRGYPVHVEVDNQDGTYSDLYFTKTGKSIIEGAPVPENIAETATGPRDANGNIVIAFSDEELRDSIQFLESYSNRAHGVTVAQKTQHLITMLKTYQV